MKIVFMIPRLTYSGAPKMMAWVANQMAERGHDVHFVTFFSSEKTRDLHNRIRFHSLNVTQSNNRFKRNTTGMIKTLFRLHRYVKSVKADVIVSFLDSVGYTYLPLARLFTKSKIIVSERVDPYAYKGMNAKLRFALMKFAHGTVFQTKGAQAFFKGKIYKNSTVIPNPVVIEENVKQMQKKRPTYAERDNRIVTVGRLSLNQKRQDLLIEAFSLLHKEYPYLQLIIYGDGQDKQKIQALIEKKGLQDSVILAGRIKEVEKQIFNAKAFVLSSDFEGIPNALIEAMSIGVPCVATDCSPGGAALLIENGKNGYLVPCNDTQALKEKLKELIEFPAISEQFSQNSIEITERFSEYKIANLWEEYFLNCKK